MPPGTPAQAAGCPVLPSQATFRALPARMADRLIVALDVPGVDRARDLLARLDGAASFFKLGYWLAFAEGVDRLIADLTRDGRRLFLDAKFHDIGQTVQEGVARAADRGVSFVTVHAEPQVIAAAVRGARGTDTQILAVTVLTSLTDAHLAEMGYALSVPELVARRARQAAELGAHGIVASAQDNPAHLREQAGAPGLLVVTPGIRSAGDAANDQQRHATPAAAIRRGADYLVVGRPIIAAADPAARARAIIAEMEQGAQS